MYQGQNDLIWLVPLFLAGLVLLAAARHWWFVTQDEWAMAFNLNLSDHDLRNGAFATCLASWLLALAALGFIFARP